MTALDGGREADLQRSNRAWWRPRPLGRAALVLAAWVVVEGASFFGLWMRDGMRPSPTRWRDERRQVAEAVVIFPSAAETHETKVLHPYMGFTNRRRFHWRGRFPIDDLGFVQVDQARAPEGAFVVGVFGGSMAQMLALFESRELERLLAESPGVAGRAVRVVDLAMSGFKQPQQLMSLAWTQAIGLRIDAAVLLDGFNDGVFPEVHNRREGVSAFYPRGWRSLSETAIDPERLLAAGELAVLEHGRGRWAQICSTGPLRWSAACQLAWSWWDRRRSRDAAALRRELEDRSASRATALGPADLGEPNERRREVAAFWGRCAVLMRQICDERGIAFAHFLQPNQYVVGAKPMSATERRLAVRPNGLYGPAVAAVYPELERVGRDLLAAGEPFVDLTRLFAQVEEPVYADDCCHLNDRGNRLLAAAVAAGLAPEIARAARRFGTALREPPQHGMSGKPQSRTPASARAARLAWRSGG